MEWVLSNTPGYSVTSNQSHMWVSDNAAMEDFFSHGRIDPAQSTFIISQKCHSVMILVISVGILFTAWK